MHKNTIKNPCPDTPAASPAVCELEQPVVFPSCPKPTLGVELEVSLIDPNSFQLAPHAEHILQSIGLPNNAKPELFQSIIELTTDVCESVGEVKKDLSQKTAKLHDICKDANLITCCTGTHPFALWRTLPISSDPRYQHLVSHMQWPARRLLICGLHVHVGVKSGEHAIAVTNALTVFLPHLLALSASSPYWEGFDTGLASSRTKIFEGLPTAGLPPYLANWGEFVSLMRTLYRAGSIRSIREIWWDIRPHPTFGTVEIRICDGVNTLDELCALTAFIQCIVVHLQQLYDAGEPLPFLKRWTLKENKWRAARFGLDAHIIRNESGVQIPLQQHICDWVEKLQPIAASLGCTEELLGIRSILKHKPSYQRQRAVFEKTGSLQEVVKTLTQEFYQNTPL